MKNIRKAEVVAVVGRLRLASFLFLGCYVRMGKNSAWQCLHLGGP